MTYILALDFNPMENKEFDMNILERITLNNDVCGGKPTIRNMRFTVTQMLELLASGMTHQEILDDYPYIEAADINACLIYASRMANTKKIVALAA